MSLNTHFITIFALKIFALKMWSTTYFIYNLKISMWICGYSAPQKSKNPIQFHVENHWNFVGAIMSTETTILWCFSSWSFIMIIKTWLAWVLFNARPILIRKLFSGQYQLENSENLLIWAYKSAKFQHKMAPKCREFEQNFHFQTWIWILSENFPIYNFLQNL